MLGGRQDTEKGRGSHAAILEWEKEELDLAENLGKSETRDEMQETYTSCSFHFGVGGNIKKKPSPVLMTSVLGPISPAS